MTTITIQSQEVQAALNHLEHQLQNLQPVFNVVGKTLKAHIADCFREEKSPDGINWAALSPVTKMAKAKRATGGQIMTKNGKHTTAKFTRAYLNGKILQDTGRLKNSITHHSNNSFVEVTTDAEYAAMMNFGGTKAQFPNLWGDIPARPFFPSEILPQNWETEILEIINNHLQN